MSVFFQGHKGFVFFVCCHLFFFLQPVNGPEHTTYDCGWKDSLETDLSDDDRSSPRFTAKALGVKLLINCTCCSTGASIYFACWLRRIYSQISCLAMNKFIVIIYTWCGGTVFGNPKRGRSSEASFHWVMILFMLSKVKLYSAFSVYSRNGRKHRPGAQ